MPDDFAANPHVYLSTGCLHGHHRYCQSMVGAQGDKRPGQCKFCDARCICPCHQSAAGGDIGADVMDDPGDQDQPGDRHPERELDHVAD
jgi:hypothetical protein